MGCDRAVELGRRRVGDHIGLADRIGPVDRTGCKIVVVERVNDDHKVGFVHIPLLRHILATSFAQATLFYNRLVAHMAFHTALGSHADCGAVRRLRAVLFRSLDYSHNHRLAIWETWTVQDSFVALRRRWCQPVSRLSHYHYGSVGLAPCLLSFGAWVAPQPQHAYHVHLPNSALRAAHPR